ncbi:hypothetical protein U0C82_06950 [Fulvimarina sp. 2208YS6-2-32]|uniref:Uncharacterized protein n=1 Tax=Fulvimarina uroteuthidis TaxID=3098149 RepID=A0ABU5I0Y7_9HYPH|nr:hypothetical protein [Fulvimarina sp. 2208YS6-2-32]MDY8108881.1 hypothetical protein [Fulvimarina sp. 2208YS6-2-32]
MARNQKPFTVAVRKSRRQTSERATPFDLSLLETRPEAVAPAAAASTSERLPETPKADIDRSRRILPVVRADGDGETGAAETGAVDAAATFEGGPDAPGEARRRYRRRSPVRRIDPAEYQMSEPDASSRQPDRDEADIAATPDRAAEAGEAVGDRAEAAEASETVETDETAETAVAPDRMSYRMRRRWMTGNVPVGERWSVRRRAGKRVLAVRDAGL